jgi:hypothetical protein
LGSIPDEEILSVEIWARQKNDTKKKKLLVSARKLKKRRPQRYKSVLRSGPGEDFIAAFARFLSLPNNTGMFYIHPLELRIM